jgi:hypothetical protein
MTASQQHCWHCTVDDAHDVFQTQNAGGCEAAGESFGTVMHCFVVGVTRQAVKHQT